jgi:hypothetical protein
VSLLHLSSAVWLAGTPILFDIHALSIAARTLSFNFVYNSCLATFSGLSSEELNWQENTALFFDLGEMNLLMFLCDD